MKKIPFYETKKDLQKPFNKKIQKKLTSLFKHYNVRLLPTNFSDYFGAGPALAENFSELSRELNPHRLNQNCYYCTIAALTNQNVLDMVAETEIMQQDTASLNEITYLFHEAGVPAALMHFDDYTLPAQQLWEQTYNYIDRALAEFEAMGLAWMRQPYFNHDGLFSPAGGHMVVVAKDGNGTIAVLDYQSGNLEVLSSTYPPEGAYHQSYSLFQQYALMTTQSWTEAYYFIAGQYMKNISWRGVMVSAEGNHENIFLYHIPEKKVILAEINNKIIKLDEYNDPRGNNSDSALMICSVR